MHDVDAILIHSYLSPTQHCTSWQFVF